MIQYFFYLLGDLHSYVKKYYPEGMSEEMAVSFLKQLMNGFAELRNYLVIHRDMKPANLFLMNNGLLKIGDFGFAKYGVNVANSILGKTIQKMNHYHLKIKRFTIFKLIIMN